MATAENISNWLDVQDHWSPLLTMSQKGWPGESYNVGAANEQTIQVLIDRSYDALESFRPASGKALRVRRFRGPPRSEALRH